MDHSPTRTHTLWGAEQDDLLFRIFRLSAKDGEWDNSASTYPRKIENTGVCICLEGDGEVYVNHKAYRFSKDDAFILFPGTILQLRINSDNFTGYMVGVSLDLMEGVDFAAGMPLYMHIRENPCITLTQDDIDTIIELGDMIKRKVKRLEHPFRKEIGRHLMLSLLYEVSAIYQRGQPIIPKRHKRDAELLQQFLYLVTQHCRRERKVEYYAGEMLLTAKYLSSAIRSASDKSPTEWINQIINQEAKMLLRNSTLTIHQISIELGFPNPSFFGQFFKRHNGITPREYRRSI